MVHLTLFLLVIQTFSSPLHLSAKFASSRIREKSAVLRASYSLSAKRFIKSCYSHSSADLMGFLCLLQQFIGPSFLLITGSLLVLKSIIIIMFISPFARDMRWARSSFYRVDAQEMLMI